LCDPHFERGTFFQSKDEQFQKGRKMMMLKLGNWLKAPPGFDDVDTAEPQ
jgi:hypothetical protein